MEKSIKQTYHAAKNSRKVRFGAVGVINAAVDFSVLGILVSLLGTAFLVPANIVSTTFAMITSFMLNKKAVFPDNDQRHIRQVVLFFAITITGIWVVQTSVMFLVYQLLLGATTALPAAVLVVIAKVIGIGVGLVWNYMWYSRVVFKAPQKEKK